MNIVKIKNKIFNHYNLNQKESLYLFEEIMSGNINDIELSSILIGLRMKNETKEEIIGAAKIMREKSLTANTGPAGSSIKITADAVELEKSLNEKNFCFLFAQNHHSAMKNVINVRKILATRTIFNLLGPLTNPANSKNQLLGVFDKKWLKIHCEALKELGSHKAMIVHGIDGLDEITLTTNTLIVELKNNTIEEYIFNPTDFGYEYIKIETIKGGDSNYNAKCFVEMLDGNFPNFQKIVEINAGAALYLGKIADYLKEGFDLAKKVIEEGRAKNYLNELIT